MGGNCGGIIASYVYLTPDGPRYIKGHSILIGFVVYVYFIHISSAVEDPLTNNSSLTSMAFFLTLFTMTWFRCENARRNALTQQIGDQELTEEQKKMERELVDNVPWFRYST